MYFDRPDTGQRALLLSVRFDDRQHSHDLEELRELVISASLDPVTSQVVSRHRPDPKYCIGSGKVNEIAAQIAAHDIELLVVDHELSATQQRNLEAKLKIRVISRTELILHVFEERARTREGKLQVELAMLRFAQTHIVQGWTHLDRQRGGGGVTLRGAGERQSAIDKGLIHGRIHAVEQRLQRVAKQRAQQRHQRLRNEVPTIALVGYTNAGKSTLFNALTQAAVYADDRLFATLDPTMRQVPLPDVGAVVLSDTVGFIRDLPTTLVAAFRATLEEVAHADLLLHVMDIANPNLEQVQQDVQAVLDEIGAGEIPCIDVFNKIDLVAHESGRCRNEVYVSAALGDGLDTLLDAVAAHYRKRLQRLDVHLDASAGHVRAWLHRTAAVENESFLDDGGVLMSVALESKDTDRLLAHPNVSLREQNSVLKIA